MPVDEVWVETEPLAGSVAPCPQIGPEDGFDVEVIEEVGMLGLDDRLSRGALGLASKVWVLDGDLEPKLVLLELPSDAALVGQSAPVSDDATTVAADFEGLGLVEMGLNFLGEAAKSHACDGSIESCTRQLRDDIDRGELLVECLRRVDCLGQGNQAVSQCAIANELVARAPERIGARSLRAGFCAITASSISASRGCGCQPVAGLRASRGSGDCQLAGLCWPA